MDANILNPTLNQLTTRDQIIEIVDRLFIYTDDREWEKLKLDIFTDEVRIDMSSVGGPDSLMPAAEICAMWDKGFADLDGVHHQAGNYLVTEGSNAADVLCYATATHYKKAATQGHTRTFVGSYNIRLIYTNRGWRIDMLKYNLKWLTGNIDLV